LSHGTASKFWRLFAALPTEIQELARENFELLKDDPVVTNPSPQYALPSKTMRTTRTTLLVISIIGFLGFGSAFLLSFMRPLYVESLAKEFIRREIEEQVRERVASLDENPLLRFAQRIVDRNGSSVREAKQRLAEGVPQQVAAVIAQMQDPDCKCREFVKRATAAYLTIDLLSRTAASEQLIRFIQTKYSEVVRSLLREFRIFTAANALLFLLLGMITWARRAAVLQLLLPAIVLIGAALLVGSLYLFGQDWLHTILFSDYLGYGYFAYLGLALIFLGDVVLNHARVTTVIVNAAFDFVGAAIQAVPC
jgi:hypothetical protein